MPAGLHRDRPKRVLAHGPQIMARTIDDKLNFWTSCMPLADGSVCKYANCDVGLAALRGFRCICRFHGLSDLGFYDRQPPNGAPNRLSHLSVGVVKGKSNKHPKLRCSAGMIRHLIPWGMELAEQFCDRTDPVESSMYFCMQSLSRCYAALA
eukprot:7082120-Pyramimonas_sp.AAC.1